ncbi:MAG: arylsulfatase, partial [Verrucomicrobiota bacterium]
SSELIIQAMKFAFVALTTLLLSFGLLAGASKPNIILILTDDMGFSDISCYGGEIPTPHLDSLAERGVKLSQFYNATRCCPTRASLLTGLYQHRAGVGGMTDKKNVPGYQGYINEQSTTISEVLHESGYFNILTGKWHVGWEEGVLPWERKFDRNLCIHAGGLHYSDQTGGRGKRPIFLNQEEISRDDPRLKENASDPVWYGTRLWTRYGLKFAEEAIEKEQPFFWYMPYVAPHFPCMAPEETVAKYKGKYMQGWDKLRQARIDRQREIGLIDQNWQLSERPDSVAEWDSLSDEEKEQLDYTMAIYAAMMEEVDQAVGRMITFLKERDQFDNTLFLFMSDNGSSHEGGNLGQFKVEEGSRPGSGQTDIFVGRCWANLNNAPFRKSKMYSHEGGSASPMIACWPDGIAANSDWVTTPAHVIDILPTLAEITGSTYPKERNGHEVFACDGVSLKSLLTGEGDLEPRALYWEHFDCAAIRVGDRKLARMRKWPWELYDMGQDRTETNNLAKQYPEEVEALSNQWKAWANEVGVFPKPGNK